MGARARAGIASWSWWLGADGWPALTAVLGPGSVPGPAPGTRWVTTTVLASWSPGACGSRLFRRPSPPLLPGDQTEAEGTGRAQQQTPGPALARRGSRRGHAPRPARAAAAQRARAGGRAPPRRLPAGQPAPWTPGRCPGELVCYSWVCGLRLHSQVRAEKHSTGVSCAGPVGPARDRRRHRLAGRATAQAGPPGAGVSF